MAFLSGYPEAIRRKRRIVVIQAFADESESKRPVPQPTFVMVALAADAEVWLEFADRWKAVLDSNPRIPKFSMQRAASAFRRNPTRVERRVRDLVALIREYEIPIYSVSMDLDAFKVEIASGGYKYIRDPYFYPFNMLMGVIAHDLFLYGWDERYEIVFDENNIFAPRAKAAWPTIRAFTPIEWQAIMPIDPRWESDDNLMPLQAADLIGGFLRMEREGEKNPFDWIRSEIDADQWATQPQHFDRERLQASMERALKTVALMEEYFREQGSA